MTEITRKIAAAIIDDMERTGCTLAESTESAAVEFGARYGADFATYTRAVGATLARINFVAA